MTPSDRDLILNRVADEAEEEFMETHGIVDLSTLHPDVRTEMEEFVQDRLAEVDI